MFIMTIKQITVFLENKTGRLNDVAKVLGANNINMLAFCIAETVDFGLMRLIVHEVDKAVDVLRDAGFAVILTDVIAIHCDNRPGALSKILESLAENDIFIEYMYAFAQSERADVIINPNDLEKCVRILEEKHSDIL